MIAYNNQPGSNSLTDLFEDIIANNKLDVIKDYNYFVSNIDRSSESLIPKNDTINEIAFNKDAKKVILYKFNVNSNIVKCLFYYDFSSNRLIVRRNFY